MSQSTSKRGPPTTVNATTAKKQRTENDGLFEIPDEILKKLICTECNKYLSYSPVMMDPNGHNICGRCSNKKLKKKMGYQRIQVYEDLAKAVLFPCRYDCREKFAFDVIKNHEEKCKNCTRKCPVTNCNWEGTALRMEEHFEKHPGLLLKGDIAKFSLESFVSKEEMNVPIKAFDNLFLLRMKYVQRGQKLKINVGIYKSDDVAKLFVFDAQLTNAVTQIHVGVGLRQVVPENQMDKYMPTEISAQTIIEKSNRKNIILEIKIAKQI